MPCYCRKSTTHLDQSPGQDLSQRRSLVQIRVSTMWSRCTATRHYVTPVCMQIYGIGDHVPTDQRPFPTNSSSTGNTRKLEVDSKPVIKAYKRARTDQTWNWVTFCDPATQRPSDPRIQRPGDLVDPVTLFYNEL